MTKAEAQPTRIELLQTLSEGLKRLEERRQASQIIPYSHASSMIKAAQERHGEHHAYDHH